ncbi:hypothetical protein N9165_02830 [Akkermansiaceae bacterium]|nr:hypothetical protein [Akkermansiaceae bacterium]
MIKSAMIALLLTGTLHAEEAEKEVVRGHVFAWPFTAVKKMQPRGGSTEGSKVTLDPNPARSWKSLHENGLKKLERDRRAILALAGSYRVSFDFIETMGFQKDYAPPKGYFSWGTEHVQVLANEQNFVSLQHTLVMYFEVPKTKEVQEMIMKHWRQDWRFEDDDLHVYAGANTWKRKKHSKVTGKWSQAVFQVDDSPRYETVGRWSHAGEMSTWRSENSWRPLPRREFSVRSDYNILAGFHEITVTQNGWVHVQQNRKLNLGEKGKQTYVGQELGVNRYERISEPSLRPALTTWKKDGAYWAEVRQKWAEIYASREAFTLQTKVDDKKLYQLHFGYAAQIEEGKYDEEAGREHARSTIEKFLADQKEAQPEKY